MAAVTFVYAVGAVGVCHVESVHEDGECVFETQGSWQSALLAATHRAFSSAVSHVARVSESHRTYE